MESLVVTVMFSVTGNLNEEGGYVIPHQSADQVKETKS